MASRECGPLVGYNICTLALASHTRCCTCRDSLQRMSLVVCEFGSPAEGLPTGVAFVRFRSSVEPVVLCKRCTETGGLPPLTALVGLLPYVSSQVVCEVGVVKGGLPTAAAFVGFISSVNSEAEQGLNSC